MCILRFILVGTDELKRPAPYDPDETVSVVYSSGTTGEPKGVLLTQQNIYSYLLTARQVHPERYNKSDFCFTGIVLTDQMPTIPE